MSWSLEEAWPSPSRRSPVWRLEAVSLTSLDHSLCPRSLRRLRKRASKSISPTTSLLLPSLTRMPSSRSSLKRRASLRDGWASTLALIHPSASPRSSPRPSSSSGTDPWVSLSSPTLPREPRPSWMPLLTSPRLALPPSLVVVTPPPAAPRSTLILRTRSPTSLLVVAPLLLSSRARSSRVSLLSARKRLSKLTTQSHHNTSSRSGPC
mmetsp:Transcript_14656/g.28401  ORF Transcript_14656/g.28401 Transcript_14656/m.28401 type:complete len:208 (-) Transcript_14656:231-854(-)